MMDGRERRVLPGEARRDRGAGPDFAAARSAPATPDIP